MKKLYLAAGLVAVALVVCPRTAIAQVTTGMIEGQIIDPQGLAVPGASVTITSGQGSRTVATDSEGRFRVPFLTPGSYDVKAELTGFKTIEQRAVDVRLGQTAAVNLRMELGGLTEVVQVTNAAPIVDTTTTTTGGNLDIETLTRVPVGRRVSDTLYLVPGVTGSGSAGSANPSISGGSALDNQYVVDGVNVTNMGFGGLGSYSIVFGSLGTATPFDFVKEVQVKTGGYEAEFGQATGGLVNVVTRSGTNALSGSVFSYFRPQQLEGNWKQFQSTNGSVNTTGTRLLDGGLQIGGPVVKDRLFFFGAIDPSWERQTFVAPADFPLASLGDVPRERRIVNYAAKGTYQEGAHRIDVSVFGDPATGANGPQRGDALLGVDTAKFSKLDKYGGNNQNVSYNGALSQHWLLEANVSHARNQIEETPSVDTWLVRDRTVTPSIQSGGIGFYESGNDSRNMQYQAKATTVVGGHDIRYGLLVQDIAYDRLFNRTGPTFTTPDGKTTATGAQIVVQSDPSFGNIYRVERANLLNSESTTQLYTAVFVQDTWRVGSRLTITPGLRYERQSLEGSLEKLTLDNNWAPRIGVAFDPTGAGRSKIYAHWGRFFAQVPNDLAARALSSDAGISRADYFDAALTRPVPEGVSALGVTSHYLLSGVSADLIDPNSKSSYVDEAVFGGNYEVLPHTNLGIVYTHRTIPRVLEDVGPYAVGACDILGEGCSFDYTLTNPNPSTVVLDSLGAQYEKPIHKYDAVSITADRRFSDRWGLQASYTWSKLRGTFEGFYRDDNGQSDPGITSLYDFPTNDPSYTQIGVPQYGYQGDIRYLGALGSGPLPLDRTHQIKLYGNYAFPAGLNLGVGLNLSSGRPLTALAANPNYTNSGEIPITPRGGGFETIDGFRTRTPWEYYPDAHVDYAFRVGGRSRIVVLADVFNFLNLTRTTGYDNYTELSFGVPNPDFGKPVTQALFGAPPQFQAPLQTRIGLRVEF